MDIAGISSGDSPYSANALPQNNELDKDAFMQLLVSQLQNQDPFQPTDNQQYIAQLAEFSSLEQMEELNDNIVGLALLQQGNALMDQLTNSGSLIGQSVTYVDPTTQEELTGLVSSVKIEEGQAVLMIDGKDVPLGNVTEINGTSSDTATDPVTDGETTDDAGSGETVEDSTTGEGSADA